MGEMAILTESLLADAEIAKLYQRATQSPFLRAGGRGRLDRDTLSQWLSQDRLYAQAYVRFIGGLISRVELPAEIDDEGASASASATLPWRILALLQACLAGITRELQFFEDTARRYNLGLAAAGPGDERFGPNATTKGYIELFDSFAARPRDEAPTLFEGLVVLWATESAYLAAWSYADRHGDRAATGFEKDRDGGALRGAFIPNWTSTAFRDFVNEIRECADAYAENMTGEENADARFVSAAAMVKKVFVLEEGFWPIIAEEEDV